MVGTDKSSVKQYLPVQLPLDLQISLDGRIVALLQKRNGQGPSSATTALLKTESQQTL